MFDRIGSLIADVQAQLQPRDRLPEGASGRWPGTSELENEAAIEAAEPDASERFQLPLEGWIGRDTSGLRDDIVHVGFPEPNDDRGAFDDVEGALAQDIDSIDALAFYLPFHFYRRWGIYVLESGLLSLAADIDHIARHAGATRVTPSQALEFAYRILWSHEFFHHMTEVACARLQHWQPPAQWLYPTYFQQPEAGLDEEALANAYALKQAKRNHLSDADKALRQATRVWMRELGPGYRDFQSCEGVLHAIAKDRQVDHMAGCGSAGAGAPLFPGRLYRDIPIVHVPTYLVHDAGGVVGFIRHLPSFGPLKVWTYSNDHKPPHVHTGSHPAAARSERFGWPDRTNMDGAKPKIVKQFNDYADRYSTEISANIDRIPWK